MPISERTTTRTHEYELGHSDQELKRLGTQALLVDPITQRFFRNAGIERGMRVLDVGSGAGDVAFLAADLVGAEGEVVGTDRSSGAVATAQARARQRSLNNVSFQIGDVNSLEFDRPFDAVVGRYVLMFSADPAGLLKTVARHVKPGGIVVFHEVDWSGAKSVPNCPIYNNCHGWITETFNRIGTNAFMGLALHSTFMAAGLAAPTLGLSALVGGGSSDLSGIDLIADLATTMAPAMEEAGVVSADELGKETLQERMRAEIAASGSVVVGRSEVGAWTRVEAI
jgi:2-polyprenyl-3-methyl-5-hydroxy-6-metoxy-1,4-benzoquinol methylase